MLLKLSADIQIFHQDTNELKWKFNRVQSVKITRDSETLTDTCSLELPGNIEWKDCEDGDPVVCGDGIVISLGYNDDLSEAFCGYVASVGERTPMMLECTDEMHKLKGLRAKQNSYKEPVNLQTVIDEQELNINCKILGEEVPELGAFRITAETLGELFSQLNGFGIRCYVGRDNKAEKTLFFEQLDETKPAGEIKAFCSGEAPNIIDDKELKKDETQNSKLLVIARSIQPDNELFEESAGEEGGNVKIISAPNMTRVQLKSWASKELRTIRPSGLTGSFTTFGGDLVSPTDRIGIMLDGKKRGVYKVKKNEITYDTKGFRQKITLGNKVAE